MLNLVRGVRHINSVVLALIVATLLFGQTVSAGAAELQAGRAGARLTPSPSAARPGEVVNLEVTGLGREGLRGGVASFFDKKTRHGWQRLYLLHWFGRGDPSIRDPNALVEDVLVQGTSFPVVVPPVKPGTYRITRRYIVDPGTKNKAVNLTAKLTVLKCPARQTARFIPITQPADPLSLGAPQCVD